MNSNGHSQQVELEPRMDVKIGEADAGLNVDTALLPERMEDLLPEHVAYLSSLPPTRILGARAIAYEQNNSALKEQAKGLRGRSSELEAKLRRVVALCTGAVESAVDGMVEGLVVAVESERAEDAESGKVREFLRRVEAVEG